MSYKSQMAKFKKRYKEKDTICKEGDESHEFFILATGTVGIYKGAEKVAQVDKTGTYFGELAALLKQPRSATMKAETDVEAYALPGVNLTKLVEASPELGTKLIMSLASRLSKTTSMLYHHDDDE